MKKKLSRLLCALLVMTMVLAMVPAVSAAEPTGTVDDPIIMYVGDNSSEYVTHTYGCTNTKHSAKLQFTEIFNGRETALSAQKYVSFDKATGTFKATTATYRSTSPNFGLVKVTVGCAGEGKTPHDDFKAETVYFRVYSVATGITLKTATGSTLSSLSLPVGEEQRIYYTMNPASANPNNVDAWFDNSNVKVLDDGWDEDAYGTYFTVKATKGGVITTLNIELDGDTSHKPVTKEYSVLTGSAANLTLKTGSTVLAQSGDDGDSYIESSIGKTISITATADTVIGSVS